MAAHVAALAECDERLRVERELGAEMARWPPPLRCWLALQRGDPAFVVRIQTGDRPRINIEARGLPRMVG